MKTPALGDQLMQRILSAPLLIVGALVLGAQPAQAASEFTCPNVLQIGSGQTGAHCVLGLNKSKVIELPRPAKDVLVSNPAIADAVMRANNRIYITGLAVGQASIFIFDRDNKLMINLELDIERDITGIEATVNRLIPGANIKVQLINDNIVLSGTVKSAVDAKRAADLADAFANGGQNSQPQQDRGKSTGGGGGVVIVGDEQPEKKSSIVNLISIEGQEQVMVKVTVAEMQRSIIKQLGIDLSAGSASAGLVTAAVSNNNFPINSTMQGSSGLSLTGPNGIGATLRALEQTGLMRTLAEPTLTAISGESASFLAGGEFPVPTGRSQDSTTITFKPYGVALAFTPVVLSEGRISLRVKTEVSSLSMDGSFTGPGTYCGVDSSTGACSASNPRTFGGPVTLPSLRVRRAETTLELPSGGSMVMAGLLQDDIQQAISGVPGLKNLPVLGALFRSRDFQKRETELVIIITPYMVKPTARSALARPDDGFNTPNDASANFLGRLNRMYGVQGKPDPKATYQGRVGYIYE
jgi:pilus assembly protein CpaC